ncbi:MULTISPECIES: hypothetical protein [Bacteroides]|jgi:hypothetical protein|nr:MULTISPECIES: hypothetical protein [Bacteroides]MBU8973290.1 hypothetical protein [Bacteroides eggerthii]MBU8998027.1 hypothetical protein [Bacteroides eggerthii]MCG4759496.1 hypothetical protein [Bacteroides eggerthii]QRQ48914.1 hypothetical protein I6J51_00910 [Bacteroides eggerthii]
MAPFLFAGAKIKRIFYIARLFGKFIRKIPFATLLNEDKGDVGITY